MSFYEYAGSPGRPFRFIIQIIFQPYLWAFTLFRWSQFHCGRRGQDRWWEGGREGGREGGKGVDVVMVDNTCGSATLAAD